MCFIGSSWALNVFNWVWLTLDHNPQILHQYGQDSAGLVFTISSTCVVWVHRRVFQRALNVIWLLQCGQDSAGRTVTAPVHARVRRW